MDATSFIDIFYCSDDLEFMKKIIYHKDEIEGYGLWQMTVTQYFGKIMKNTTTRMVEFCATKTSTYTMSEMRILFAMLLTNVPAIQHIVVSQMMRAGDDDSRIFFENYFLKSLQITLHVMLNHSFNIDDIDWVFYTTASYIQYQWQTKTTSMLKLNLDHEIKLLRTQEASMSKTPKNKKKILK
jgi:hypothetical protein